jgi:ABC-2 type transport system permease protein
MTARTYMRYELLRTFRNRRFLFLSLALPLAFYLLIAVPNRHETNLNGTGLSAPLYMMVGLAGFGAMNAIFAIGGRIAAERQTGWNRQLRLTPLTTRAYFRAKTVTGYAMATATILLLYIAGAILGVRLGAGRWVEMTLLMLIALVPFAALAVGLGHVLNADSIGPAIGGLTAMLSILGGMWFPPTGTMRDIAEALPSFWLVEASHVGVGGSAWGMRGWIVMGAWTLVLVALARRAYARDTQRG